MRVGSMLGFTVLFVSCLRGLKRSLCGFVSQHFSCTDRPVIG